MHARTLFRSMNRVRPKQSGTKHVTSSWHLHEMAQRRSVFTRSSSREVRLRLPFFLWSILVGEPSPKKVGKRALLGDLVSLSPKRITPHCIWPDACAPLKTPASCQDKRILGAERIGAPDGLLTAGTSHAWVCLCFFLVGTSFWLVLSFHLLNPPGKKEHMSRVIDSL